MPDVQEILRDRGKSYGSYDEKCEFVQWLKDGFRETPQWYGMHPGGQEALDMIATKIGRLLHGDPRHEDSWVDIAGYADLAAHGDPQSQRAAEDSRAIGEMVREIVERDYADTAPGAGTVSDRICLCGDPDCDVPVYF